MRWRILAGLAVTLLTASAQARGIGATGESSVTPARTSDSAVLERGVRPAHDLPLAPTHGMMGAPGAGQDSLGPSRLGQHGERPTLRSYGEAAPGTGDSYAAWHSGDRVRSPTSADVRAARQQQAPDLEWADASRRPPQPQR